MPRLATAQVVPFNPLDPSPFTGLPMPDPITFVVSPLWLNRPNLYPRQATLLKVIFLREDLFTEFDYEVVEEWEIAFRKSGQNGINPGILDRMRLLRLWGYSYFREVLLVMGRRAGKGYVAALALAYVLWRYMAKGNPQEYYGIDPDKKLACFIFASKKDHAIKNLWGDLSNVVKGAPCFTKYISRPLGHSLSIFAPHDFVKINKQRRRGIRDASDPATFLVEPKESTLTAGRGPTSFAQGYDEMAHQVGTTSRSAEDIYGSATPALDQFKKDRFIIDPSSPWQMVGQFYENWLQTLEVDRDGIPVYPDMFMLQLASWEIYYDWEDAHLLPLFPAGFLGDLLEYTDVPPPGFRPLIGAIQEYDLGMERLERANPETFGVERRSLWQTTQNAYLNPKMVDRMFEPWNGKELVLRTTAVNLTTYYKGHADPSLAGANFAISVGHTEKGPDGLMHCVFDYIHHYVPSDFEGGVVDYIEIGEDVWRLIEGFKPDEFTYDQWNSAEAIQRINKRLRLAQFPKRVLVYEKTATAEHNWQRAETFKVALNQGWIHAPPYVLAVLELKYLQLKNGNKVVKQDTGPVTTKDIADTMMEVVWTTLGDQVNNWVQGALSELKPSGGLQGGMDPYSQQRPPQEEAVGRMSTFRRAGYTREAARAGGFDPSRNPQAGRHGRRYRGG